MMLSRKRELADAAASRLQSRREQLSGHLQTMQGRFEPWRPAVIVGGGLLVGYLLGQRQVTRLASGVASVASMGIAITRTSIGPLAMAMMRGKRKQESRIQQHEPHRNS